MNGENDADLDNLLWHRSFHSSATRGCVEVAFVEGNRTGVRDSKNPTGPALIFASESWTAFASWIRGSRRPG